MLLKAKKMILVDKVIMRLNEISKNINIFSSEKMINYIESNIELAIKNTIKQNPEYYWNKEYAKPFINN